ncbi:hypothetical protein [Brevibacterium luteolum]|uniref:hypothetical protein n=1 Tax=Brevibacterium luteolum TaxID=199591 RepID=UPI00223BC49D|nr:hypothetical protein [Brevibacterium luteolum]MCT1872898.1 hypothetical protein [Brevibacterium luteolum]MCT1890955.1 hypothetical protein [Brevibacterium luteolum]MCT1893501.1 hypothetical protein [Brevibacterium luteolum]MCT1924247.1 hypothetical protein [Brevibacterium luteolum]
MIIASRVLSIAAVGLLAATIPVPVLRVEDAHYDDLAVNVLTAVGLSPVAALLAPGILIAVLMVIQTFAGWRPGIWAWIGYIGALFLTAGAFGAFTGENRPSLMWDGVDDQGRPTGGMEVPEPWLGLLLIVCAAGALAHAATLQVLAARQAPLAAANPEPA